MEVKSTTTVASIRNTLWHREAVPPNQQRLTLKGKQLEETRTLGDYNIERESTIILSLRISGGCTCEVCGCDYRHSVGVQQGESQVY